MFDRSNERVFADRFGRKIDHFNDNFLKSKKIKFKKTRKEKNSPGTRKTQCWFFSFRDGAVQKRVTRSGRRLYR